MAEPNLVHVGLATDLDALKTQLETTFQVPVESVEFLEGDSWVPLKDPKQLSKSTRVRIPCEYPSVESSEATPAAGGSVVSGSQDDEDVDARSFKLLVILPKAQEQVQFQAHNLEEFLSSLRSRVPLEGEIKAVEVPDADDNWSVLHSISQLPKDITKIRLQVGPASAPVPVAREFMLAVSTTTKSVNRRIDASIATLAELRELVQKKINADIQKIEFCTEEDKTLRVLEKLSDLPKKARLIITERRTRPTQQPRHASPPKHSGGNSSPPQASLSSSPASLSLSPASSAFSSPPSSIPPPSPLMANSFVPPKQLAPPVSLGPSAGGLQHSMNEKNGSQSRVQQPGEKNSIFTKFEVAKKQTQQHSQQSQQQGQLQSQQSQHSQQQLQQSQPQSAHSQPQLAHSQPQLAHSQPQLAHSQPQLAHSQPKPASIPPRNPPSSEASRAMPNGSKAIFSADPKTAQNSSRILHIMAKNGGISTAALKQLWISDWVKIRFRPVFLKQGRFYEIIIQVLVGNVRVRSKKSLSYLPAKKDVAVFLSEDDIPCYFEQIGGENQVFFLGFDKKECEDAIVLHRSCSGK